MILLQKVKVCGIDGYNYTLIDNDTKEYIKNIEFINTTISIGDYIYLPDNVLKETNIYTFGPIQDNAKEEDIIKLIHEDKEIYLERYYG